jgi:hypothetical protein
MSSYEVPERALNLILVGWGVRPQEIIKTAEKTWKNTQTSFDCLIVPLNPMGEFYQILIMHRNKNLGFSRRLLEAK